MSGSMPSPRHSASTLSGFTAPLKCARHVEQGHGVNDGDLYLKGGWGSASWLAKRGIDSHDRKKGATTMTDQPNQPSGITNAPLEKEQDEQAKVPPEGESIIGKGQNRNPSSPQERREQRSEGGTKNMRPLFSFVCL